MIAASLKPVRYSLKSKIGRDQRNQPLMTKYEIILYWSNENEAFIADAPELPGCAADGATRQEDLSNGETVILKWLETAREPGHPMPETMDSDSGQTTVQPDGVALTRLAHLPRSPIGIFNQSGRHRTPPRLPICHPYVNRPKLPIETMTVPGSGSQL